MDFVTGATIAIRRSTWDVVGRFDEGFYPAYYEDADYCYRTHRKGIETACANTTTVKHLISSNEWGKNQPSIQVAVISTDIDSSVNISTIKRAQNLLNRKSNL